VYDFVVVLLVVVEAVGVLVVGLVYCLLVGRDFGFGEELVGVDEGFV